MDTYNHEQTELKLYCDNTYSIYKHLQAVRKNLRSKQERKIYKSTPAIKGFLYAVNAGAQAYCMEHCGRDTEWYHVFSKPVRVAVAEQYVQEFEQEVRHVG